MKNKACAPLTGASCVGLEPSVGPLPSPGPTVLVTEPSPFPPLPSPGDLVVDTRSSKDGGVVVDVCLPSGVAAVLITVEVVLEVSMVVERDVAVVKLAVMVVGSLVVEIRVAGRVDGLVGGVV